MGCAHRADALERLQETAAAEGWRRALDRECGPSTQLHRYATDPREADCVRLLSGVRRGRALFLGNALGILPCLLAELFESVVVADWDAGRLAFARYRSEAEALGNLTCALTDGASDVPHRLGQFDLVALGEECPEAACSTPFTDRTTLRHLAAAVAAGGWLMYGVRFPLLQPLVTAARRPWAARRPAFYPAHAGLLVSAGFPAVRGYGRHPDRRPYQVYLPLDSPAVVRYWLQRGPAPHGMRSRISRTIKDLATRMDGSHYLFNNFLVVARREG